MRVSKIPVPTGSGYPFLIFVSYLLRVLSASTDFFDIPSLNLCGWIDDSSYFTSLDLVERIISTCGPINHHTCTRCSIAC